MQSRCVACNSVSTILRCTGCQAPVCSMDSPGPCPRCGQQPAIAGKDVGALAHQQLSAAVSIAGSLAGARELLYTRLERDETSVGTMIDPDPEPEEECVVCHKSFPVSEVYWDAYDRCLCSNCYDEQELRVPEEVHHVSYHEEWLAEQINDILRSQGQTVPEEED